MRRRSTGSRGIRRAGTRSRVIDPRENLIGRGFFSPGSAIPVRILVRDAKTRLDAEFFRERIERAFAVRREMGIATAAVPPAEADTTGYRLVHAEGDRLPGLIVDRFGDAVVVQLLTVGMKMRQELVFDALLALGVKTIIDRTPPQTAKTEGFEAGSGVVRGDPVRELVMKERGLSYRLPLEIGQKTGFYFDQRGLRARVEELAQGKRVLDTYSYVGAFAMAAARGGATDVIAVDESAIAIEVAKECARANGLEGRITHKKDDARRALQEAGAAGEGFDLVHRRSAAARPVARIARGGARRVLEAGGARVPRDEGGGTPRLLLLLGGGRPRRPHARARDRRDARGRSWRLVVERHFQGADHPVRAAFAEGLYLKALVARMEPR